MAIKLSTPIRTHIKDNRLVSSRREEIAKCAARVLVKQGYERTSVREIAEACGMSIGTLYRYVGSKEDILYLVIDQGLSKFVDPVEDFVSRLASVQPTQALKESIERYFRGVDEGQDIVLFSYQETRNLEVRFRERILDIDRGVKAGFEKILTKGCEEGVFSIDNVGLLANTIVAIGGMWAVRRWSLRNSFTLEEYIRFHTKLLLRAVSKDQVRISSIVDN